MFFCLLLCSPLPSPRLPRRRGRDRRSLEPALPGEDGAFGPKDDPNDFGSAFSIGPAGGYLRQKDADRGHVVRRRPGAPPLRANPAAEASITFHQNRYADGDVSVTQYPVQLTAMLYVLPVGPLRPYILGGVGWYYTRFDYSGVFNAINDRTEHIFGWHSARAPS
jgi:hypothetical protein